MHVNTQHRNKSKRSFTYRNHLKLRMENELLCVRSASKKNEFKFEHFFYFSLTFSFAYFITLLPINFRSIVNCMRMCLYQFYFFFILVRLCVFIFLFFLLLTLFYCYLNIFVNSTWRLIVNVNFVFHNHSEECLTAH